jgi:hypothetical protein
MSSLVRGCCAITLLAATACGQHLATSPNHPTAEARNGETEKKPRKQRPLVAPPPAYGNKIVHGHDSGEEDVASADLGSAAL